MAIVKLPSHPLYILLLCTLLLRGTAARSPSDDEAELSTSERKIKERPVVIHTQQQQYDQPTLDEYTHCRSNLDSCLAVCDTAANPKACESECPTCPLLIDHDVVVQGINDTDYRVSAVTTALNTTNVIKLTNEIHNLVENNMGNVTAHNVNNIHVSNNVSTTGGRYGLGYNERGSCCLVVRPKKHCSTAKFATASRCHRRRLRVCGERCKARVMYAHRVRYCNDADASDCHVRMQYVPQAASPAYRQRRSPRCYYQPRWPFVACGGRQQPRRMYNGCQRCLQISYGYILQHGVPTHCIGCYRPFGIDGYMASDMYSPNNGYDYAQPPYVDWSSDELVPMGVDPDNNNNNVVDFDDEESGSGWRVTKKKCRGPGGIVVDCTNAVENNDIVVDEHDEKNETVSDDLIDDDAPNELDYETVNGGDYDDAYNDLAEVEAERRRRRHAAHKRYAFHPSAYSKRHQNEAIN